MTFILASASAQGESDPTEVFSGDEPIDANAVQTAARSVVLGARGLSSTHADRPPFPLFSVRQYVEEVARDVVVEQMEDGRWFAEAEAIRGAWGDGETADEAVRSFRESVYKWAMEKMLDGDGDIPVVGVVDLNKFP